MFGSNNIQTRPTTELFVKSVLTERTWNNRVNVAASLFEAVYDEIVVEGGGVPADEILINASFDQATYLPQIFIAPEKQESLTVSASLSSVTYESQLGEFFEGDERSENIQINSALDDAQYSEIIKVGTAPADESIDLNTELESATYEIAQ